MISYLCIRLIADYDNESGICVVLYDAMIMAFTEIMLFLIYLNYMVRSFNQIVIVSICLAVVYAVYHNITAYIDYYTGYVYQIINILCQIIVFVISIFFFGVSPEFLFFYIIFVGIIFSCEKLSAFYRGDTEVLIVSYCFFANEKAVLWGMEFMFVTLLISAFIFDVFRRITGRKEGDLSYTPFIILAEFINLLIYNCILQ